MAPFGSLWIPFGCLLDPFGCRLPPFWLPVGSLWIPLAPFWLLVGSLWLPLDPFGSLLAPCWLPLNSLWFPLVPFCVDFGSLLTPHGAPSAQVDSLCGGFALDFAKLHPRAQWMRPALARMRFRKIQSETTTHFYYHIIHIYIYILVCFLGSQGPRWLPFGSLVAPCWLPLDPFDSLLAGYNARPVSNRIFQREVRMPIFVAHA